MAGEPEAVADEGSDASVTRLSIAVDHPSVRSRADSDPVPLFSGMPLGEIAERAGLKRIDVLAWRDFDDPEAGGSELHAHRVVTAWSDAGLDVSMTTSSVPGGRRVVRRDGYRVIRRAGRYSVFPRSILSGAVGRIGTGDGTVEIWNGMPFFSPVWSRSPQITFLHHVHAEMWRMVLPRGMAEFGHALEHRIAPPFYRRSRIVTLSQSSKAEIVERLRLPAERISVTPPGVEPRFAPGGERSGVPLVVAVGRLVPVKRFHLLIEALAELKATHPDLRAVIAGEGYERPALEALRREHRAESWIELPGFVDDEALVGLYRSAWVVASSSLREGWGMTVTEAGACGTPSVATRIGGHEDAVVDGQSGILVDGAVELRNALDAVLRDEVLRRRLGTGALEHAARFTWDATARGTLAALGTEALTRPV
ncbi:MAG: glycosyltransferase family 4 protein [Acidimicrobiales bacterium]|jgi:glycosyltransferase involved in cell wall biosynthesis